ncbi:MAG: hypothetical protein A2Z20_06925 [Bdellovibrionales bacterium RBG_16_40_8]|nr:MAG: hypothetical protein A2Z20_06925 [Bdellovibrionales bacterium RBG_16_40_8]
MSYSELRVYEAKLERKILREKNRLSYDIRALRSPNSFDITVLKEKLHEISIDPQVRLAKRVRAQEAYENIVIRLGGHMQQIRGQSALVNIHAKVLFGDGGSAQQVQRFLEEYNRLLRQKGYLL